MAHLNCPTTSIFPHIYGLDTTSADFGFTSAKVQYNSIDTYGSFLVAGGKYEMATNPLAMVPDVSLIGCDEILCDNYSDTSAGIYPDKGVF